jgi:putative PIN family toxin of toxin-antitoxin system
MTALPTVLIVVFDTNALLPLLVGYSPRTKALRRAWQARRFEVLITPHTLAKVERVLSYPRVRRSYALTGAEINAVVQVLKGRARLLPGLYENVTAVLDDVSDNIFLAAALEAGADYLVTQDAHLLRLKYYHGTQTISLAQFVRVLALD